jgi:phosphohistidine phosphatase SixA
MNAERPEAGVPTGRRQAEGLVFRLEDYPVEQILSSPTLRCHQTVEPLARDRLLPIEPVAALGVDAAPAQIRSLLWDWRLRDAVVCTHAETIAQLFTQLALDAMAVAEPLQWPKGSTWLLRRTQRQLHARYLGPLALDPVTTD